MLETCVSIFKFSLEFSFLITIELRLITFSQVFLNFEGAIKNCSLSSKISPSETVTFILGINLSDFAKHFRIP